MPIRLGLIGCGNGISSTHVDAVRTLGYPEIAAVCDIVPERARKIAHGLGLPEAKAYTNHLDLLADPAIDAVLIGTTHASHAPIAIDAARAGKHVLSEKPMATSVADCRAMIEAAEAANVKLGVVFQHRFDPSMVMLKRAIDDGSLGRPLVAIASVPWLREQSYYDVDPWKGTWGQEGGSSLINQGIHTLDRMVWLMGKPVSVIAETAILDHRVETEDVATLSVVFEGGGIGSLTTTVAAWPSLPERLEFFCSGGSATIVGSDLERFGTTAMPDALPHPAAPEGGLPDEAGAGHLEFRPGKAYYGTGHVAALHDFFSAISENRSPSVDGYAGLRTVAVICAAYQSARTGMRTAVEGL